MSRLPVLLFLLAACSEGVKGYEPTTGLTPPTGSTQTGTTTTGSTTGTTSTTTSVPDRDGDGTPDEDDCAPDDSSVYPGAEELCNGVDDDCDGVIPQEELDLDGDGTIECEETCPGAPTAGPVAARLNCEYAPSPTGTPFAANVEWALTHEITDPTNGAVFPAHTWAQFDGYGSVYQAPAIAHMTGRDYADIVVVMAHPGTVGDEVGPKDAVLRLIGGDGSDVHAIHWASYTNANGTFDYAPYHYAGVAAADVDGDGWFEVATLVMRATDETCYPALYEVDGTGGAPHLTLEAVAAEAYPCGGHAAAIADLDLDGQIEVVFGRSVYAPDLSLQWEGGAGRGWFGREDYPWPDGYWNSGFHSFAYDMDGDGAGLEVVAGRTVYAHDGTLFCELGDYEKGQWVPATDGYPAVADVLRFKNDSLGEPEIVITGNEWVRVYHGVPDYDKNGLQRCTLVTEIPNDPYDDPAVSGGMPVHPNCDTTSKSFGGPSTIADFDGDGDQEVAVAGACWYSVYDFNGKQLERYAMAQTKDWSSSSTGSTVFDFNGDGLSEVVFSDEEAVYVWGVDGAPGLDPWDRLVPYLVDDQHKSWTIHEYPMVADLDGDGKAEILVSNAHKPDYLDHFGLYALGAADGDWVSSREVWNQHAYYITSVEDDGAIGVCEPNYAPYTAENYNSFRTQAPGSFGALSAPNAVAVADACQAGCGDLTVWVQAANEGEHISLPPDLVVSVYGVSGGGARTLLGDQTLGQFVVPMYQSDPYTFVFSGAEWSAYDHLVAVVDDPNFAPSPTGKAQECDETDNEVVISLSGYCP